MTNRATIETTDGVQNQSVIRIGGLAVLASLSSVFYYAQRGEILMHGDATAHINIARRVFDSLTPGPLQLGTVWLPLPHLLMIPFIYSRQILAERRGWLDPVDVAYVLGVLGIVRLVGGCWSRMQRTRPPGACGRVARGVCLRSESQPDLHAGHRADRTFVSRILYLDAGLLRGISSSSGKSKRAEEKMKLPEQRRPARFGAAAIAWRARK